MSRLQADHDRTGEGRISPFLDLLRHTYMHMHTVETGRQKVSEGERRGRQYEQVVIGFDKGKTA